MNGRWQRLSDEIGKVRDRRIDLNEDAHPGVLCLIDVLGEIREVDSVRRGSDVQQETPRRDRQRGDLRRAAGMYLYQVHPLVLPLLAEVELEQRPGLTG